MTIQIHEWHEQAHMSLGLEFHFADALYISVMPIQL